MFAAARRGDTGTVMNLIATAPSLVHVKEPINGWTPLHIFARLSLAPAVQQMLALGADTEARDGAFRSPLHLAARADASPTLPSTVKCADASAAAPSSAACGPHDARAVATMGALLKGGARLTARDSYGMTPLHHAAQAGLVESVNFLLGLTVSLKMMRAPLEAETNAEERALAPTLALTPNLTPTPTLTLALTLTLTLTLTRSARCTWQRRADTHRPCVASCNMGPTPTTQTTCSNRRCTSPSWAATALPPSVRPDPARSAQTISHACGAYCCLAPPHPQPYA